MSNILHFIICEKSCALQSKSKYHTQTKTLSLHSSLVKGWQLWTWSDTLTWKRGGENTPYNIKKRVKMENWKPRVHDATNASFRIHSVNHGIYFAYAGLMDHHMDMQTWVVRQLPTGQCTFKVLLIIICDEENYVVIIFDSATLLLMFRALGISYFSVLNNCCYHLSSTFASHLLFGMPFNFRRFSFSFLY